MSKKDNTKVFSVRTDNRLLEQFEKIAVLKNDNKNSIINSLLEEYVTLNCPRVPPHTPIPIYDNIDKFGYKRDFFTNEDATFIIEKYLSDYSDEWDRERDKDYLEFMHKTYVHTGIKYSFQNLNLRIYSMFHFIETIDSFNTPTLDYRREVYLYDEISDELKSITDQDFTYIVLNNI